MRKGRENLINMDCRKRFTVARTVRAQGKIGINKAGERGRSGGVQP